MKRVAPDIHPAGNKGKAEVYPETGGSRKASGRAAGWLPAFCLLTALFCSGLGISSAAAAPHPWKSLTPLQQEALAPLSQQWNGMPETQQRNLMKVAKYYPDLSPEEKQRFLSRLKTWSSLTPQQRQAARDKYRAFSQVPKGTREQVRQMVKEEQAQ